MAGSTTGRRRAGMGVERNRIEKEPRALMILIFPMAFSARYLRVYCSWVQYLKKFGEGHVNCHYAGFPSELFLSLKYAIMDVSL